MRLPRIRLFSFLCATLLLQTARGANPPEPSPTPKPEWFSLFPGQSHTFQGVTLTWLVGPGETSATTGRLVGTLEFRGLTSKVAGRPAESPNAYIDRTLWSVNTDGLTDRVQVSVHAQTDHETFDARPLEREGRWVSSVCPVYWNEWRVAVSEKPRKFPGGFEYHEIRALNTKTKEQVVFPATQEASGKFGRFSVQVDIPSKALATTHLSMEISPDLTARGADAYLGDVKETPQDIPVERFLEDLAKKYGFEVEWAEGLPGRPESIAYVKKLRLDLNIAAFNRHPGNWLVKDVVATAFAVKEGNSEAKLLAYEWKDPMHLRVWAKTYDAVLKERAQAEKEDASKKNFEELFDKDYGLQTRAYPLKRISPATAKALVDPELRAFFLAPEGGIWPGAFAVKTSTRSAILALRVADLPAAPKGIEMLRTSREQCIADEKSNALLVTAIPETHNKVREILDCVDGMLSEDKRPAAPPKRYRLEAILLEGGKKNPAERGAGAAARESNRFADVDPRTPVIRFGTNDYVFAAILDADESGMVIRYVRKNSSTRPTTTTIALPFPKDTGFRATSMRPNESARELLVQYQRIPPPATGAEPAGTSLKAYGLSDEDVKLFGFSAVQELGKAVVTLAGQRGDEGKALASLNESYAAEFQFQDVRPPYLIVKGRLVSKEIASRTPPAKDAGAKDAAAKDAGAQDAAPAGRSLLENTLFLEKDKPSVLGLTNLRQALILVVRLHDAP